MDYKEKIMYVVVYCCASLPDQIITGQLSFEDASWLSCELTAELLLERSFSNPEQESYIVQPLS
jgi:hypothetical protein